MTLCNKPRNFVVEKRRDSDSEKKRSSRGDRKLNCYRPSRNGERQRSGGELKNSTGGWSKRQNRGSNVPSGGCDATTRALKPNDESCSKRWRTGGGA